MSRLTYLHYRTIVVEARRNATNGIVNNKNNIEIMLSENRQAEGVN